MRFPVTVSNILRLIVRTTVSVIFNGVVYLENQNGSISVYPFRFSSGDAATANILGGVNTRLIPAFLENSKIISIVLELETAGIQTGECFVRMDILQDINSALPMKQLLGCYITSSAPVSYPENLIENSLSGAGRSFSLNQLLVGGVAVVTVPANVRWELEAACVVVVKAVVGTQTYLKFIVNAGGLLDAVDTVFNAPLDAVILYDKFNLFPGGDGGYGKETGDSTSGSNLAIPKIPLSAGSFVYFAASNFAALSQVSTTWRQWIAP